MTSLVNCSGAPIRVPTSLGNPSWRVNLVQILQILPDGVGGYVLHPPATNGLPSNSNNVVAATTRIGHGVDPAMGPVGRFGLSITDLNLGGAEVRLAARVFNAPSLAEASFYKDSDLYNVPVYGASSYGVFIPRFSSNATTQMLDETDGDGDGGGWGVGSQLRLRSRPIRHRRRRHDGRS